MPRDLVLGNGSVLVNFDLDYQLRDVYYPYVGMENHTSGHPNRWGLWVDGTFTWLSDPAWQKERHYRHDSLVSDVRLTHPGLGLTLECRDTVDFHEDVLIRCCTVTNARQQAREVRLFYHHDFHIYGNNVGDTAYFDPNTGTVIHYKDRRYLLINGGILRPHPDDPEAGPVVAQGLAAWATGKAEIGGAEGTWRDAEDGQLGNNPIAQGAVDSTIQLTLTVPPAGDDEGLGPGQAAACLWLCFGTDYRAVAALDKRVRDKSPLTLLQRTDDYWHLWANEQDFDYGDLPDPLVDLFKHSLLIVRTQIDNHGAVIAANDTDVTAYGHDTYSYMWPRDGALVTYAMAAAGYRTTVRRFFDFCEDVISEFGCFLHKYNPDGSVASSWHPWEYQGKRQLPIQEDETALVLWALWRWFQNARNVEDVKDWYRPLIIAAGDFMVKYRDPHTGLPQHSYDLWEERRGVFAWTVGAVYGGLRAAASFAEAFGERDLGARYQDTAESVKAAVEKHMYNAEQGRFVRMVTSHEDGHVEQDLTLDASMVGLFYFGMFPPDDDRIVRTMQALKERLWVPTPVGGMARYENDQYQRQSTDVTGNPWYVCTLWLAQWLIAKACTEDDLAEALPLLQWVADRALPSGVMAEQINPLNGLPISVSPLTWSHASYIATVVEYLDRKSELSIDPATGIPRYFREQRSLRNQHQHHVALHHKQISKEA